MFSGKICCRNHKLKQGPCSVISLRNLVKKFEETECTCERSWNERRRDPVKVVAEVHSTISVDLLHSAKSVFRNLDVPKTPVLQILPSVLQIFPYRFKLVQALESGDNQHPVDFAIFFLIRYDKISRCQLQILWTDEAHFKLTGNVSSKNCFHWVEENPHGVHQWLYTTDTWLWHFRSIHSGSLLLRWYPIQWYPNVLHHRYSV